MTPPKKKEKQSINVQCPSCGEVVERIEDKTGEELQEWGKRHEKCQSEKNW